MATRAKLRRLIVPCALAVSVAGIAIAALSADAGCGTGKPKPDARLGDGGIDTPIV